MKFFIDKMKGIFSTKEKVVLPPHSQRYYYPNKKLIGKSYESEIITKENIANIIKLGSKVGACEFKFSRQGSNDFEKFIKENPLAKFLNGQPYYKNVRSKTEDIEFTSSCDGVDYCYLPPSIEFYNDEENLTYFIAIIENECEICSTKWRITFETDKNTNARVWYDTIGQYTPVTNVEIIQKIENTLVAYKLQQEAILKIMEPIVEDINLKTENARQVKRNDFEKISQELSDVLAIIGVSKERYDELVEVAFEEDDNHIGELLVLLSEDDNYTYLDWKSDLEDVHFCLNEVAKKQNIEEIPEDGIDFEKELFCEDALRYLKSRFDKHVIYTIDVGSDGVIAGILDNETGEKFIDQMSKLFEKNEFKKESLKIEKL